MANTVKVDTTELVRLGKDMRAGAVLSLGRLAERGRTHLVREIPYQTGNLKQGVAPPEIDNKDLRAVITVSARSAAVGAMPATVHSKGGKTRQIMLRPQIAFNYAEVVAKGRPAIRPKVGRALIIPVSSPPADGSYISSGGKFFVVRRSAGAQKANPFDQRAADKLQSEAPAIVGAVFGELFN